jgi:hypothetical protein
MGLTLDVNDRIRRLEELVERQQRQIDALAGGQATAPVIDLNRATSRRDLLRLGALGAAGAAGAAVLAGSQSRTARADGDAVTTGIERTASNPTAIKLTSPNPINKPTAILLVHDTTGVWPYFVQYPATIVGQAWDSAGQRVIKHGVYGYSLVPNGMGVVGESANFIGVFGFGGDGIGVQGSARGEGVVGTSVNKADLAAWGTGRLAQLGRPVGAGHTHLPLENIPETIREKDGSVWVSRASNGLPIGTGKGAWRRVNSLRLDSPAGDGAVFAPFRAIETRPDAPGGVVGGVTGPLNPGTVYLFGPFPGIPVDALGIVANLTLTAWTGNGFAGIFPAPTYPNTSNVNFGGSSLPAIANAVTVGFGTGANAGRVGVYLGPAAGAFSAHVILDIFAYIQ